MVIGERLKLLSGSDTTATGGAASTFNVSASALVLSVSKSPSESSVAVTATADDKGASICEVSSASPSGIFRASSSPAPPPSRD